MPWILMHGDWAVQIEDGIHAIHAEVMWGVPRQLKIIWDGGAAELSKVGMLWGNFKSFQHNGHSFKLRCFTIFSHLNLFMDGMKVRPIKLVLIEDLILQESEEVISIREYPLDNRFGDQVLNVECEISHESSHELTINEGREISGGLAMETEIKLRFFKEKGIKIGDKVAVRDKQAFAVGPRKSVLYKIVWKRKVRSGNRRYLLGGNPLTIPYRIHYGLAYEIKAAPLGDSN